MSPTTPPTEEEVRRLLSEALDLEARRRFPDSRRPPVVDWPAVPVRRRRSWVAPVAAAAVVAGMAVAVGAVVVNRNQPTPPPAPAIVTITPTPNATSSTGPTVPSPSPSTAVPSPSPTPGTFAGAIFTVPAGWTQHAPSFDPGPTPLTCLDPVGISSCTVRFGLIRVGMDADVMGGMASNPQYCGPGGNKSSSVDYRDLTFGGRAAEYRLWREGCVDGSAHEIAQYIVTTPAAFVLWSEHADVSVRDAMAQVVASAQLPPATSSVRLYDHGILRSVVARKDGGWDVSVDRVIVGWPNTSSTTYVYRVPASASWSQEMTGWVGQNVVLRTDGVQVIELMTVTY
jgi:hypothetical protein